MKKLTYKEAYDKIIEAYFKDEIQPNQPCFCFCGTLNDNNNSWCDATVKSKSSLYTSNQFADMESALLEPLIPFGACRGEYNGGPGTWGSGPMNTDHPDYEKTLFEGMSAALEVLKQIHKERGEDVDGVQEFTQRKLNRLVVDERSVATEVK